MRANLCSGWISTRSLGLATPITAVALLATVFAVFSSPAARASGGGVGPPGSSTGKERPVVGRHGGVGISTHRADHDAPLLRIFRLTPATISDASQGTTVQFKIYDRTSRTVRARLLALDLGTGKTVRRFNLGRVRVKRVYSYKLNTDGFAEGRYRIRIAARDRAGHQLKHRAGISSIQRLSFSAHRFPIAGAHDYGGPDARFGAGRTGHIHQGQDVTAAEGTPLVAPSPGTIKYVSYQAGGAGYYVVISSPGDQRDYVLMHLKKDSVAVHAGQQVAAGDRLGEVGATGDASGPHLHFEAWEDGGWYTGGHPVDPLPILKSWDN